MRELAERLLKRTKKSWFRAKPFFEPSNSVDQTEISRLEQKLGSSLPADLREWLCLVGYGNVGDALSIQSDWFYPIKMGQLKGAGAFGQDELGNFYAYLPQNGSVIFFSRSTPEYAVLAPSFLEFMEELERRDFQLQGWVDGVAASPYRWDA